MNLNNSTIYFILSGSIPILNSTPGGAGWHQAARHLREAGEQEQEPDGGPNWVEVASYCYHQSLLIIIIIIIIINIYIYIYIIRWTEDLNYEIKKSAAMRISIISSIIWLFDLILLVLWISQLVVLLVLSLSS